MMNMGNKGAIRIALHINDNLVEFTNCHLSSGYGEKKQDTRTEDLNNILGDKKNILHLKKVKCSFFFGDMNFKVNTTK